MGRNVSAKKAAVAAKVFERTDEGSLEAPGTLKLVRKGTTRAVAAKVIHDASTNILKMEPTEARVRGVYVSRT